MPELPEVEIVRQSLNKKIIQKTIKKVIVRNRNLRIKVPLNFKKILENQKILNVDRFSKYLILFLSGRNKLLIHLGMSGTIHLLDPLTSTPIRGTNIKSNTDKPKQIAEILKRFSWSIDEKIKIKKIF